MNRNWICFGIFLLVVWWFSPAGNFRFLNWDDEYVFALSSGIHLPFWSHVKWAWTSGVLGSFQPVSWFFLWLQSHSGYFSSELIHWVSIVLHAASTVLLIPVIRLTLKGSRDDLAPYFGALWFGLHPLRAEMVGWAASQPYLWATLFGVVCTYAYLRSIDPEELQANRWLVLAIVTGTAAILSKVVFVVLPVALFVIRWQRDPFFEAVKKSRNMWWLAGPAVVSVIGTIRVRGIDRFDPFADTAGVLSHVMHPFCYLGHAIVHTVMPISLNPFYAFSAGDALYLYSAIGAWALLLTVLLYQRSSKNARLLVGLWLFAILPGISAAHTEGIAFADRYAHLASLVGAVGVAQLFNWKMSQSVAFSKSMNFATTALLLGLMILTHVQLPIWRTSETLWQFIIESGNTTAKAYANFGSALMGAGKFVEAEQYLRRSLQQKPDVAEALNTLGSCLLGQGRSTDALVPLQQAINLNPQIVGAHSNLAYALSTLGRNAEALSSVRKALEISPYDPRIRETYARILDKSGKYSESIPVWASLVQEAPGDPFLQQQLAIAEQNRLGTH